MKKLLIGLFAVALLALGQSGHAADARTIDKRVQETLQRLYKHAPALRPVVNNAAGVLVFPRVYKAGIGGDYGEGALLEGGRTSGYYNIVSGSVGFQLGAQRRAQIIVFTDRDALRRFKDTDGWKAGVDASVVLVDLGAAGNLDTNTAREPVLGLVLGEKGLMYNATLEGSKITRIQR